MRRITTNQLAALVDQLSDRDHALLADLEHTRVLTGAHLQRLHFDHVNHNSRARDRHRVLDRLIQLGIVSTLDRRIGGIRAGSAGHVYTLTPAGRRYQAIRHGQPLPSRSRRFHTPSAPFLAHALAISGIYVSLIEASRHHDFQVSTFTTEPTCWHPTGAGRDLKPDAYTVLATTTYRDCWWLEIDRATESLPKITRKCRPYLDYLTHGGTGPNGVPPRILFTTPDTDRSDAIRKVITTLVTTETEHVISVTTHDDAPKYLITELFNP